MANTIPPVAEHPTQSGSVPAAIGPTHVEDVPSGATQQSSAPPDRVVEPGKAPGTTAQGASSDKAPAHRRRKWLLLGAAIIVLAILIYLLVPTIMTAMNTVSTDDAYVNGHVTFVAARVPGQVVNVFVDDNYRVKKGDVLVQLDKTPYQVEVAIKQAALSHAEADVIAANAQARGEAGAARAARFTLQHAMESVDTEVANLRAAVATLNSNRATLDLAQARLKDGEAIAPQGGISNEELDVRRQQVKVDQAAVDQALQQVYAIRVGLGIPAEPVEGQGLADVPPNLDQNFSTVSQDLGTLEQLTSQLGYRFTKWDVTPKEIVQEFLKQDPHGNVNNIIDNLIANAPVVKQAQANLLQAKSDLDQAELNLSYCDVVSDIDGVVTGRNVNPGDNVATAQNLMAVRSLTEIWIDANFKETELADLRIGQRVRCDVDMYGSRKSFEGRITGFTMGTGETLSLLPPQNATGNFVKIVQRLPVRVELTDYDPDKSPLFVGLSVTPYVYFKQPPSGPHAGDVLQPLTDLPTAPTEPKP